MEGLQKIRPTAPGTVLILIACLAGYLLSFQDLPSSQMARLVSVSLLLGMGGSFLLDLRLGLRNLLRVDVFALLALYFLSFFEFLFPQFHFDLLVISSDVVTSVHLVLVGLAAMAIGRHASFFPKRTLNQIGKIQMRNGDFLVIFFGAAFLSFLPLFLAVDFNPVAFFEETLKNRFSRAWGRGKYGDLSALLHELQLLGYVLPPVAGLIFARRKAYGKAILFMVFLLLLLLWYTAFTSGTRNVLAIHIAGFFAGFFVVQRELRLKVVIPTFILTGVVFVFLADHMLEFRNMGLGAYLEGGYYTSGYQEFEDEYLGGGAEDPNETGYFVDYNLWRISQLVAVFPSVYGHIGWNMPFVALTKPIPRALWPGKPTDLAVGLEEAIGAEGYTIAATWIGEAYVAGGLPWVIVTGLLVGAFCGYWNHLANFIQNPFALIVFASGFFAVLLLMRSLMFFTTSLLPSVALIVMGLIIHKNRQGP